jgi:hypothetical protein
MLSAHERRIAMVVQPFNGLARVLLVIFAICIIGALAIAQSDIMNPNRSGSEARKMDKESELANKRGEFDFELYKQWAAQQQQLQQQAQADELLRQQREQSDLKLREREQQIKQDRDYQFSILLAGGGSLGLVVVSLALAFVLIRFALSHFSPVQVGGPGYYNFPRQPAPVPPPPPPPQSQPQQPRQPVVPVVPVIPVAPVAPPASAQALAWKERVRQARQRELVQRQAVYGQVHTNGNGNGHNRHNDEVIVKR